MRDLFYISYLNPRLYRSLEKGYCTYLIQSLQNVPAPQSIFLISMEKVGPDNYPPDMLIRSSIHSIDLTTLIGNNVQVAYGFPVDGPAHLYTIQFKPERL